MFGAAFEAQARMTFLDRPFGTDPQQDLLGVMAEQNKAQMQHAMGNLTRFGRTEYGGFQKAQFNASTLQVKP